MDISARDGYTQKLRRFIMESMDVMTEETKREINRLLEKATDEQIELVWRIIHGLVTK